MIKLFLKLNMIFFNNIALMEKLFDNLRNHLLTAYTKYEVSVRFLIHKNWERQIPSSTPSKNHTA